VLDGALGPSNRWTTDAALVAAGAPGARGESEALAALRARYGLAGLRDA
jgi:hypothetical protein